MNQHYTNCKFLLEMHNDLLEQAADFDEEGNETGSERCLEMATQTLQRAQIEATLATLTENQING